MLVLVHYAYAMVRNGRLECQFIASFTPGSERVKDITQKNIILELSEKTQQRVWIQVL